MSKKLLSEQNVLEASRRGAVVLHYEKGTIITTAALDRARLLGIKIIEQPKEVSSATSAVKEKPAVQEVIAIGSDHGGFSTKEQLKQFIESLGHKVVDVGTFSEEACDYPQFAYAVAKMVSLGEATKGIMIDAVGVASAMVGNKVAGVRAACCQNEFSARSSREHNDANMLTLGGKVLGIELSKAIVKVWLESGFTAGRHVKRVEMIKDLEKKWGK